MRLGSLATFQLPASAPIQPDLRASIALIGWTADEADEGRTQVDRDEKSWRSSVRGNSIARERNESAHRAKVYGGHKWFSKDEPGGCTTFTISTGLPARPRRGGPLDRATHFHGADENRFVTLSRCNYAAMCAQRSLHRGVSNDRLSTCQYTRARARSIR